FQIGYTPDIYQSVTSYIFLVVSGNGEPLIPTGLPSDYDEFVTTPTATPTPTGTGTGTTVYIPVEYWVVILIYLIFTILLALLAGKEGLFIGLLLATIICLITSLIPLWTIVIVIIGLIVLLLAKSGVLTSSGGE